VRFRQLSVRECDQLRVQHTVSVFRFGGGDVRNITYRNCIIYETYGCPIKIGAGRMTLENLSFSNLILQDVTVPSGVNFSGRKPQ